MCKCLKEDCLYKGILSFNDRTPICRYCLETGMSRGCDADDCNCYIPLTDVEKQQAMKVRLATLKEQVYTTYRGATS